MQLSDSTLASLQRVITPSLGENIECSHIVNSKQLHDFLRSGNYIPVAGPLIFS